MRAQAGWRLEDRVEELRCYFKVGGFPSAVREAGTSGKTPPRAMETYRRWLSGDATHLGKQESYLKELLGQIVRTAATPASLQGLAQKTPIGSHHTVQEYIALLEDCFAVAALCAMNPNDESFYPRKNRKYYFRDPLIYWVALDWAGIKPQGNPEEVLAETVAHEALARRFRRLGYFLSKNGEVDFVCGKQWAIEVKWARIPQNLSKAYKTYPSAQRTVWTMSNFLKEWPVFSG